jgi:hypothetical protein
MKKNIYILKLTHENYVLRLKKEELQIQIQEKIHKEEQLYLHHANTILFLQQKLLDLSMNHLISQNAESAE